ncbi:MFS transporter [Bacillus norwichensis]|uniref:Uncharacterized protein n=1 Tax=Bacillus norwichensis TaxID=2762217 RepID=A0ABR8VR99_9BACI|nr:hypothetical protein [Bacillus norwichensis]MBD8007298.1 hypothetical protein [Bacillus norwichensis]
MRRKLFLNKKILVILLILFMGIYSAFFIYSSQHKADDQHLMTDVGRLVPVKVREVVQGKEVDQMKDLLQELLGAAGAMQKTSEKAMLGDFTNSSSRGAVIGYYHFWTSIFAGAAVMLCGLIIDLFTIDIIFYLSSFILFLSGFFILKIKEGHHGYSEVQSKGR